VTIRKTGVKYHAPLSLNQETQHQIPRRNKDKTKTPSIKTEDKRKELKVKEKQNERRLFLRRVPKP
jgi:hypothetical protein